MSGKERRIGMKFRKLEENQLIVQQLIKTFFKDWEIDLEYRKKRYNYLENQLKEFLFLNDLKNNCLSLIK
jgi:hypothetical protein